MASSTNTASSTTTASTTTTSFNTNASGLKRYAQPLVTTDTFSMRLAIAAPKGGMLTAGNYVSTVTVDCLSPI